MPYMYPDLNVARDLANAGAAAVMPLAAPIGSNKGLSTREFIQILIDEIDYDWKEYIDFLEDEKISRVCEFRGGQCIDFDDELRNAIVNTLKKSLNDTNKSINYNHKKIALNRVIDG